MENQNNSNNEKPVVQQTFNFYGPIGQQIAHVDKIEAHFDKDMGMVVNGQDVSAGSQPMCAEDDSLVDEISGCFFGIIEDAREFVRLVRAVKRPTEITNLVNAWIKMKKISSGSCHRDLWRPLHEHGLYKPSETNWNRLVGR